MTIYYLYVKTHTITGLMYLGYTKCPDPHKYKGSGTLWLNHLNKHGYLYDTKILQRCFSKTAIKSWGMFYSTLWSVSSSKKWANLKDESGDGGACYGERNGMFGKTHSIEVKKKLSQKAKLTFKGKSYVELYGQEKATKLKEARSAQLKGKDHSYKNNPRYDLIEYTFHNINTGEIISCTRWVLINYYKINKTGASDIINKGITYKGWCLLY